MSFKKQESTNNASLNEEKDDGSESNEDEASSSQLNDFSIDNSLEKKLKKHGLNRRNAKTIIREILNDENVRGLLQANLENSDMSFLPEPKQLRSREKNVTSDNLKFTDLPLLDDDDEEDDEYHPEEPIELDTTFDTEVSQDTRATDLSVTNVCSNSNDSFMAKLKQCNEDIEAIHQNSEKEIIALRTRSKHSLMDVAMAEIETAFKPPDVSEDMYKPSGDDDWHKWLAELMLDDSTLKQPEVVDDDEDPDYNFLLSDTEDVNDREDFRTDPATHIPKQEVQVLLQERQLPTVSYQGELQAQNLQKSKLLKSKLCYPRFASKPNYEAKAKQALEPALLRFTQSQVEALQIQLQQHVQLLVQVNLLCRNKEKLILIEQESRVMLEELKRLEQHDKDSFDISSSHFNIPHLPLAIDLVSLEIKKSDPMTRISKILRNRGCFSIERNVAVVMATTPVFAYIQLLPVLTPPDSVTEFSRMTFTSSEDNLLVLGLNQMQGHGLPWSTLVHRYMMPCKLPDQLKTRYASSHFRNDLQNPIRVYKKTKALPFPPTLGLPSPAPTLLESSEKVLPDWLIALQEELQAFSKTERKLSNPQLTAKTPEVQLSVMSLLPPLAIISSVDPIVIPVIQSPLTHSLSSICHSTTIHPKGAPPVSASQRNIMKSISSLSKSKSKRKSKSSMKRKLEDADAKDDHQPVCKISNTALPPSNESNPSHQPARPVSSPVISADKLETPSQSLDPPAVNQTSQQTLPCELSSQELKEDTPHPIMSDPISKIAEDHVIEEEDDEVGSTEDDDDEEIDFQLNEGADEMSEEEDVKKCVVKKKKKELKVKWRSQNRTNNKQLGGRLHRLHPSLMGKKKSKTSEDALSKNLRESALKVKMLEEETIVQLDPLGVEKEMLFAQGYLKRMKEVLADEPEVFIEILQLLSEFDDDISQSPPVLFKKLSKILTPWPQLIQGFAPFLIPEQAQKCGLFAEQQVYARARKFLRQLEIRFNDNPQQLTRILGTFKTIAETGVYREHELKNSILSLLKCDHYLQEEFLMFFDDERPPESRLHGDYEEVVWNDDLTKDPNLCEFEQVQFPAMLSRDHASTVNDGPSDPVRSPIRQNASKSPKPAPATPSDVGDKIMSKMRSDVKETGGATWEELPATDTEENGGSGSIKEGTHPFLLPDIALISEDALSCSPFKRHNPPESPTDTRPQTPISGLDTTQEISLSSHPQSATTSSTLGSSLPVTPTGSKSSGDDPEFGSRCARHATLASVETEERRWTYEDDNILLLSCKERGATDAAFMEISSTLQRNMDEVRVRFQHLMRLLSGREQTDTDTTSHYTDSESEINFDE